MRIDIKNPQSEQIVRAKVKQYFTRAEELKELLRKRKNGGAGGGGGGGPRAGVIGSNGADSDAKGSGYVLDRVEWMDGD